MFVPSKYLPNPHDPFQATNLRWRRCWYLIRHGRRPSRDRDDRATIDGWHYLQDRRARRDHSNYERLAQRHPAVAAAHHFFRKAAPLQRAEIEARLLARESDETIARKCHLTPAVVSAYHDLFFAVRPHLHADIYIVSEAIGRKAFGQLSSDDHAILLKLVGFFMGGLMVDKMLDYFAHPPAFPVDLTQVDDQALEKLHSKLQMHSLLLSMTMPTNASTAARLSAIWHLPTQTGILGKAAGTENSPLSPVHAALDSRALLVESGAVKFNAAKPAKAEVACCVPEQRGSATPYPCDWQAVPA
jgi:hypothetical protein